MSLIKLNVYAIMSKPVTLDYPFLIKSGGKGDQFRR